MEIKIIKEQEVPILDRKQIDAEITFDNVTPDRFEVKKAVAAKTGSKEELTVIRKISNKYGKTVADVKAYVYNNEEAMKKIETEGIVKRNTKAEEPKEGEQ